MSKLKIQTRITLWYVFFTTAIMVVLLSVILGIMYNLSVTNTQNKLKQSVNTNFKEIEYDNKLLVIDDDVIPYHNNIYTSVYNLEDDLLYGYFPPFFHKKIETEDNKVQRLKADNKTWYVYDEIRSIEGRDSVRIRAVSEQSETEKAIIYLVYFSLIALPIVIVLAGLSGYTITQKAFKPIQKIQQTVVNIEKSKDLSRRIRLGDGNDEIYQLSNTFDAMFDRIQESFENEKQFTSDASHELRTPTAAIMSQCEYALNYVDDVEEAKEVFATIFDESKKMNKLLSHLLLLARANQNTQNIVLESLDLSDILDKIVDILNPVAEQKNIKIKTDIQPNITIEADEMLIMRLFSNLISNSISYGKEDGCTIVRLEQEENTAIVKITDNGIGISKENIHKIWKRFYQVEPARSSIADGSSGLGLSIVKWIVEAHNGSIQVESVLGEGTTFTVDLPMHTN